MEKSESERDGWVREAEAYVRRGESSEQAIEANTDVRACVRHLFSKVASGLLSNVGVDPQSTEVVYMREGGGGGVVFSSTVTC